MHLRKVWETDYRHDRRKHRHRCFCCQRIVNEGEHVLVGRVRRGTHVLHMECTEQLVSREGDKDHPFTWANLLYAQANL